LTGITRRVASVDLEPNSVGLDQQSPSVFVDNLDLRSCLETIEAFFGSYS
jgi:hypothetical protein